jgi:Arc/MetJ-type ribon-helix-helix transcriptional regulator
MAIALSKFRLGESMGQGCIAPTEAGERAIASYVNGSGAMLDFIYSCKSNSIMTNLLTEAFSKAQDLPEYLQNELAEQLIEDIENEQQWQQQLSQPQPLKLEELAAKALNDSANGKTRKMVNVSISLPDNLKDLIEAKVLEGGYGDSSQYLYYLICQDIAQSTPENLEQQLLEGLESGHPVEVTDEWWVQKRAQIGFVK